mgnify:CR=1 FL=1|jgi:hypothetical protein
MTHMIVVHKAFEDESQGRPPYEAARIVYDSDMTEQENLEFAFRWTQNIHDSWSKNMEHDGHEKVESLVDVSKRLGLRSTSVGDLVRIVSEESTRTFRVAGIGFKEVVE